MIFIDLRVSKNLVLEYRTPIFRWETPKLIEIYKSTKIIEFTDEYFFFQ